MKRIAWLAPSLLLLLASCQTSAVPVTIFADGGTFTLTSAERVPADLLAEAGLALGADDRVLYLGSPAPPDTALDAAGPITLTVRRALTVTLVTPEGTRVLHTSAASVGQALTEAGILLAAADRVDPPVEARLVDGLTITYQPAAGLVITADGMQVQTRSAAATVGQALAEAGIPLVGLDYAVPSEESPLPADGQIRVVRVVESVALVQKSLAYTSRFEGSADLELDQQDVLQAGEPGLAVSRVRVRSEDGAETARTTEGEVVIRPPQDRVVGFGTKVVIRTATVDGVSITYWRAVRVYATSYSPCRSGVSACYYYTSSRKKVQIGVIAVASRWYPYLVGTGVYVPGYGFATVEDIGGGFPDRYWIDLAYSDDDWVGWGEYVTLYFLTPVPPTIQYVLPYR
ncbi:MAG: hypothetical protein FD146_1751 [Anaerolineaceae bacterium]|nr:MAG: hypothetical protein FD146_1751 [Anaerolineaceae bacterium]